jgi:hypothetical protein
LFHFRVLFPRRESPAYYDRLMHECFRGGLKSPHIVQEAVNEATILSLVSCRMGVAFVSSATRWRCPESVVVLPVVDLKLTLPLALIWRKDNVSPLVAKFVADVRQLPEEPYEGILHVRVCGSICQSINWKRFCHQWPINVPPPASLSDAEETQLPQFSLPLLCPGVKSTTLFENDGRYVRLHHRQMSGNPVRIGDGCATVTNYKLPWPLVSSRDREGGSEA